MKNKKHIVFVLTSLRIGGLELYLLRFLESILKDKKNYSFTILARNKSSAPELKKKFTDLGINIVEKDLSFYSVKSNFQIYRFLKQGNFSTICDFSGHLSGPVIFAGYFTGIRNRITSYRESEPQYKPSILKSIFRFMSLALIERFSTKIISNSLTALKNFHSWKNSKDRYLVIPNGIKQMSKVGIDEIEQFKKKYKIPSNYFLVGHVGSFKPAKNHQTIIKTIKSINELNLKVFFILCGSGTQEAIANKSLKNLICIDSLSEIAILYQSLDLFYFPSINEGQPNALLEAMSMDLNFIASDIPSIKECIPHFAHEKLFNATDYEQHVSAIKASEEGKQESIKNLSSFAMKKFNAKKNYDLFFDILK